MNKQLVGTLRFAHPTVLHQHPDRRVGKGAQRRAHQLSLVIQHHLRENEKCGLN